jgi:hypothetical protein
MRVYFSILYLATYLHVTCALYSGKFCPQACDLTLNYATFNDTDAWLSKKVRSCRSELRIHSLYLCFAEYCKDEEETEKWIRTESVWCDKHAGLALPGFHDIVDHWTTEDRAKLTILGADEAQYFPILGEVVLSDARFVERAFTTMVRPFAELTEKILLNDSVGHGFSSVRSTFSIWVVHVLLLDISGYCRSLYPPTVTDQRGTSKK